MRRRHADIWSHPGHYLVDPHTWAWSPNVQDHIWPWKFICQGHGQGQTHWSYLRPEVKSICLLFVLWQSDHFWLRYSKFHIWPWNFKSRSWPNVHDQMFKITFDLENSYVKVMAKVKPIGYIWGLELNRFVCFLFYGNRTTFGWDIANSIFDLETSSQGHGQGKIWWSHLRPRVQSICLPFVSWQWYHFWRI